MGQRSTALQLPQPPHGPVVVDHNGKSIFSLSSRTGQPLTVLAASFETLRALCVVLDEQNVVMKEDDTAAIRLLTYFKKSPTPQRPRRLWTQWKTIYCGLRCAKDIEEAADTVCDRPTDFTYKSQKSDRMITAVRCPLQPIRYMPLLRSVRLQTASSHFSIFSHSTVWLENHIQFLRYFR